MGKPRAYLTWLNACGIRQWMLLPTSRIIQVKRIRIESLRALQALGYIVKIV